MNASFTSGPWTMHRKGCWCIKAKAIHPSNEYFSTLAMVTQRNPNPVHGGAISHETAEANARLIAAAPQLLQAALLARDEIQLISDENGGSHGKSLDFILEAINLATGQEP